MIIISVNAESDEYMELHQTSWKSSLKLLHLSNTIKGTRKTHAGRHTDVTPLLFLPHYIFDINTTPHNDHNREFDLPAWPNIQYYYH